MYLHLRAACGLLSRVSCRELSLACACAVRRDRGPPLPRRGGPRSWSIRPLRSPRIGGPLLLGLLRCKRGGPGGGKPAKPDGPGRPWRPVAAWSADVGRLGWPAEPGLVGGFDRPDELAPWPESGRPSLPLPVPRVLTARVFFVARDFFALETDEVATLLSLLAASVLSSSSASDSSTAAAISAASASWRARASSRAFRRFSLSASAFARVSLADSASASAKALEAAAASSWRFLSCGGSTEGFCPGGVRCIFAPEMN